MSKKQAVVIIHGIGEQKPMDTLRDFVKAVWTSDKEVQADHPGERVFSKPDNLSGSFELRRLTTTESKNGARTDFFEFYWAHLMEGTTYGHVSAWAKTLLLRNPKTVPPRMKQTYWLLVILSLISIGLFVYFSFLQTGTGGALPKWVTGLSSLLLVPFIGFVVLKVVGDAARYLHVAADNVKGRHEIRQAGVDLLMKLHEKERGYDRIVLVGHSLGTVIGYDILTYAWTAFNGGHEDKSDLPPSLDELEKLAHDGVKDPKSLQALQRKYHGEIRDRGCKWLVTDFVTLGSPLSHSAILLAKDMADLDMKQLQREFPTCMPTLEVLQRDHQSVFRFSFEAAKGSYRIPNHAAVFASTRWTNLYFPCRMILWGDVIGGPVGDVLGDGIKDVAVSKPGGNFLAHTAYWKQSKNPDMDTHVQELRKAVNLLDN